METNGYFKAISMRVLWEITGSDVSGIMLKWSTSISPIHFPPLTLFWVVMAAG